MTATPPLPAIHTSHPALKRSRRQDGEAEPPTEATNGNAFNGNIDTYTHTIVPSFLNLTRSEISSKFQELEWKQRFRVSHGVMNPATSPYTLDRSLEVLSRNRYGNIQPWVNSRIKLKVLPGTCDYINASPIILNDIKTSSIQTKYIATQGPKGDQFSHFWNMVMAETADPAVIIMLTQTHEGNREKCAQYFPLSKEKPTISFPALYKEPTSTPARETPDPFLDPSRSPFTEPTATSPTTDLSTPISDATEPTSSGTVTLSTLTSRSRYELRELSLTTAGSTKRVFHYLFPSWADFSKPEAEDREALLEVMRDSAQRAGDTRENARVVHCSAGVGRTGTWIAVDHLLRELEAGALEFEEKEAPKANGDTGARKVEQSLRKDNGTRTEEATDVEMRTDSRPSTPMQKRKNLNADLIFETVNALREQRMLMVMNELQYHFIYEVLKEQWERKHPSLAIPRPHALQHSQSQAQLPQLKKVDSNAATTANSAPVSAVDVKSLRLNTDLPPPTVAAPSSDEPLERSPKVARKSESVGGGIEADICHGTKAENPPVTDEDTVSMSDGEAAKGPGPLPEEAQDEARTEGEADAHEQQTPSPSPKTAPSSPL